jgi:hypothetical protein
MPPGALVMRGVTAVLAFINLERGRLSMELLIGFISQSFI